MLQKIRGDWFNAYSSLLAFANEATEKKKEVEHFKHTLARLISLLYSNAIYQVSHGERKIFECIDIEGLSPAHIDFMRRAPNRCEVILQWIQKLIVEGNEKQQIKIAPPILSRVYSQLGDGIVDLNNARKIAEFPIPFPLEQMVSIMLFFHVFLTCTVCAYSIQTAFWAAMFAFVIIFSFHSINYIAGELEDPFGHDANDLPLANMTQDMNTSLITLLAARAMTVPPSINSSNLEDRHRDLMCKWIDFDSQLFDMASGVLTKLEGRDCKPMGFPSNVADPKSDPDQVSSVVSPTPEAIPADAQAETSAVEPTKKPVGTKSDTTPISATAKKTEKTTQTAQLNEQGTSEVQGDLPSPSGAQVVASCSTSDGSAKPACLPSSTVSSAASKLGKTTSTLPEGTRSADEQGGEREAFVTATDNGRGIGTLSSSNFNEFDPMTRPISKPIGGGSKSSEDPTERSFSQEVVPGELTKVSRQTMPLNRASAAVDTKIDVIGAAGKCEQTAGDLPASIGSVNGKRDPMLMPSGLQSFGRDSGQAQMSMPAVSSSVGKEVVQNVVLMPMPIQSASGAGEQSDDLLSASTATAGRECVQPSVHMQTLTRSVVQESSQTALLLSESDEGLARTREESVASDWL